MDVFFHQYFDLDIMQGQLRLRAGGVLADDPAALVSAALALVWGLVLALLRAVARPRR